MPQPYRFGLYSFDPESLELRRGDAPIALEPQPARALSVLLASAGEVVSREDLRAAIWGTGTHVDFDRGLAYALSQIRAALQDSAANPRFLQTIPRKGYKFIAPVDRAPLPAAPPEAPPSERNWTRRRIWIAAAASLAVAVPTAAILLARKGSMQRRLGVSIFDNETGDARYDNWVHSLADAVVSTLTPLDPQRLLIIGNAAPLRQPRNIRNLKSLGRELQADFVVLGQLQNQAPGLRFVTHLIRLADGTHLRARRVTWTSPDMTAFEQAIIDSYVQSVREHVLTD